MLKAVNKKPSLYDPIQEAVHTLSLLCLPRAMSAAPKNPGELAGLCAMTLVNPGGFYAGLKSLVQEEIRADPRSGELQVVKTELDGLHKHVDSKLANLVLAQDTLVKKYSAENRDLEEIKRKLAELDTKIEQLGKRQKSDEKIDLTIKTLQSRLAVLEAKD